MISIVFTMFCIGNTFLSLGGSSEVITSQPSSNEENTGAPITPQSTVEPLTVESTPQPVNEETTREPLSGQVTVETTEAGKGSEDDPHITDENAESSRKKGDVYKYIILTCTQFSVSYPKCTLHL